jgi:hypothetical protein
VRLSDLLGCDVHDLSGASIGRVHDVRMVQDGPLRGGTQASIRVDAVLVGRRAWATRLGYQRGGVRGPWLLRQLFGALERRATTIAMADLEWDEDGRRLSMVAPDQRQA